jgi:catechol 2,3-dioxygenase-like lactoylglutathione lyase family enzyme
VVIALADLVAFVASRDLVASHDFYGGVLGLMRLEASEFANAYDAHGTQLRVTWVPDLAPAGYTVLGWQVRDITTEIRALREAGVRFKRYAEMAQDEDGVWLAPSGTRVAWFADPDGNTLSLQQAPAQGRD